MTVAFLDEVPPGRPPPGRWRRFWKDRTDWRSWGLVCSGLLHLLAVVAAIFLARVVPPPDLPAPTTEISVDLVTERGGHSRAAAEQGPATPTEQAAPSRPDVRPRPLAPVAMAPATLPRHRPDPVPSPRQPAKPKPPASPMPAPDDALNGQTADGLSMTDGDAGSAGRNAIGVKDFLRAQIERHLNYDVATLRAADFTVSIHLQLGPDGSVRRADIVENPRYVTDPVFHDVADSTRRAILVASPLQLPAGKYDLVRDVTLDFNPRDISR